MSADARQRLADVASLWAVDRASHEDVVRVACDALVDGLDTEALRELAGVFHHEASYMVPQRLPTALQELGLLYFERGSREGKFAAARVMARTCLEGSVSPRELARWMHQTFHHGEDDELERLVILDDCYDELEWAAETEADIDAMVVEACRAIVADEGQLGQPEPG